MNTSQLVEYISQFASVKNGNILAQLLGRFANDMGYDYSILTLILPVSMERPRVVIFSHFSKALREVYVKDNLLAVDPIIQLVRNRNQPFYWSELNASPYLLSAEAKALMALASEFGLKDGISFPLHGAAGEDGILSFVSAKDEIGSLLLDTSPALSWLSTYIFDAAIRIVNNSLPNSIEKEMLTERELECLYWASEGKTSGEIACILGISERTVNYHLNQVTRKTGSMNRYQAVAKGVGQGLLTSNLGQVSLVSYASSLE